MSIDLISKKLEEFGQLYPELWQEHKPQKPYIGEAYKRVEIANVIKQWLHTALEEAYEEGLLEGQRTEFPKAERDSFNAGLKRGAEIIDEIDIAEWNSGRLALSVTIRKALEGAEV